MLLPKIFLPRVISIWMVFLVFKFIHIVSYYLIYALYLWVSLWVYCCDRLCPYPIYVYYFSLIYAIVVLLYDYISLLLAMIIHKFRIFVLFFYSYLFFLILLLYFELTRCRVYHSNIFYLWVFYPFLSVLYDSI